MFPLGLCGGRLVEFWLCGPINITKKAKKSKKSKKKQKKAKKKQKKAKKSKKSKKQKQKQQKQLADAIVFSLTIAKILHNG